LAHAIVALKEAGVAVLLAEQNFHFAARVADRAVVVESGRVVWDGTMAALLADEGARRAHLQV
jgi:branched-chain amino acid transport system ATP-binding protein